MKRQGIVLLLLIFTATSRAQFGWDDEPDAGSEESVLDESDTVLRTPAIEPTLPSASPHAVCPKAISQSLGSLRSAPTFHPRPVTPPLVAVPASRRHSPCAAEVLADDCDLDPDVARAALKADIVDEDGDCPKFLGRLSANPYASDSTANPYSAAGSPYSSKSVNNPYGPFGDPYSSTSARNPYATDAPKIVAQDGTYLGELSDNPYDPDSVANPYGRYGSPYSPTSIKNPYSKYGSPYSSQSPNNPYATQAPLLFGD